jgi:UDP-2,3-diacylglucosamine pyrophosphatase LpxH
MILNVQEERLLITSDTHIGSFFCHARPGLVRFFDYACTHKYNICINGDGIDVLHTSLPKITSETAIFLRDFRRVFDDAGITVYYTIGNHDIILEHYLADWGRLRLVPFLNVSSGNKRIRIEHGHLYDPFFMKHPDMQDALTRFGGLVCRIYPPWYHWYKIYGVLRYRYIYRLLGRNGAQGGGLMQHGEGPAYVEAAEELSRRGFDAVIFGHTHHPGVLPLNESKASYINTGSWFSQPYFVEINCGEITLKPWPASSAAMRAQQADHWEARAGG